MRNLLDRLKPKHKETLNQLEYSFPTTIDSIYSCLNQTNYFVDVPFGMAATICSHLDVELTDFMYLFDEK